MMQEMMSKKNTLDVWYKWYSQGLQLSWTPIADLYTQYKNWSISTGDLESLRVAILKNMQNYKQQINKGNIIAAYDDDNQTETMFDQLRNTFLQNMITNLNASWSWALVSLILTKIRWNLQKWQN